MFAGNFRNNFNIIYNYGNTCVTREIMIVLLILISLFFNIIILAVTNMCSLLQTSQEPYMVAIFLLILEMRKWKLREIG